METAERRVARTEIGPLTVSTVFLGLDHGSGKGPPVLFETMIFDGGEDGYQTRCSTWAEAEIQHAAAVEVAKARLLLAEELLR